MSCLMTGSLMVNSQPVMLNAPQAGPPPGCVLVVNQYPTGQVVQQMPIQHMPMQQVVYAQYPQGVQGVQAIQPVQGVQNVPSVQSVPSVQPMLIQQMTAPIVPQAPTVVAPAAPKAAPQPATLTVGQSGPPRTKNPQANTKPKPRAAPIASPPSVSNGDLPEFELASTVEEHTREKKFMATVVRVGDNPVLHIPNTGYFPFAYRNVKKRKGDLRLLIAVGNIVECKLTTFNPPKAISVKVVSGTGVPLAKGEPTKEKKNLNKARKVKRLDTQSGEDSGPNGISSSETGASSGSSEIDYIEYTTELLAWVDKAFDECKQ